MPKNKKQLLLIIRLIALLKANKYPNCYSFSRMLKRADLSENLNFYHNKTAHFKCVVAKNHELNNNQLVIGRHVMTCCVEDITFAGFLLLGENFSDFSSRDWANVTAEIKVEYNKLYGRQGPVLYAKKIEKSNPPTEEVATFY